MKWMLCAIGLCGVLITGCATVEGQYRKAVESRNEEKIRKFIKNHPESPLIMDAVAVLDTVKYENAMADSGVASLQAFLQRYPTNPMAPQASQELAIRLSVIEMNELREQLAEEPSAELTVALAEKHLAREEYEPAESLFTAAMIQDPNLASAHTGMAMVYIERDMTYEADQEIDLALSLAPSDMRVQFAAGSYYSRIDRPDLAINAFQRVLNGDMGNVEAHLRLGIIYLESDQNKNAVKEFREVQKLDPDNVPCLYYLGIAYADQGDAATALRFLDSYLKAPHTAEDVELIEKAQVLAERLRASGAGRVETGVGTVVADPNNPKPSAQPKPANKKPGASNPRPTGFGRNPGRGGGGILRRK